MPSEVALAVRGPGYRAPFDRPAAHAGHRPDRADPGGRVRPARRRRRGRGQCGGCSRCWTARRWPRLRDGGIGVRELRRVAKQLDTDEPTVRLWLETAAAAGLIAADRGRCTGHHRRRGLADRRAGRGAEPVAAGLVAAGGGAQPPVRRGRQGAAGPAALVPRTVRRTGCGPTRSTSWPRCRRTAAWSRSDELAARLGHRRPIRAGGPDLGASAGGHGARSDVARPGRRRRAHPDRAGAAGRRPCRRPGGGPAYRSWPGCCRRPGTRPPSCPT